MLHGRSCLLLAHVRRIPRSVSRAVVSPVCVVVSPVWWPLPCDAARTLPASSTTCRSTPTRHPKTLGALGMLLHVGMQSLAQTLQHRVHLCFGLVVCFYYCFFSSL
jgi:hypothetical protein